MKVKVTQSGLTLCDSMAYTVHGMLPARIRERVAFSFSKGASQPRDWTQVSALQVDSLPAEPPGKPKNPGVGSLPYPFSSRSSRPGNQTGVFWVAGRFFINWAIREVLSHNNHTSNILRSLMWCMLWEAQIQDTFIIKKLLLHYAV